MMYINEYKKTCPAFLLATTWLILLSLFCIFVYHISKDAGVFIFGGIMSFIAIICILLHIFSGKSIDYIQNSTDNIIIRYKSGRYKYLNSIFSLPCSKLDNAFFYAKNSKSCKILQNFSKQDLL